MGRKQKLEVKKIGNINWRGDGQIFFFFYLRACFTNDILIYRHALPQGFDRTTFTAIVVGVSAHPPASRDGDSRCCKGRTTLKVFRFGGKSGDGSYLRVNRFNSIGFTEDRHARGGDGEGKGWRRERMEKGKDGEGKGWRRERMEKEKDGEGKGWRKKDGEGKGWRKKDGEGKGWRKKDSRKRGGDEGEMGKGRKGRERRKGENGEGKGGWGREEGEWGKGRERDKLRDFIIRKYVHNKDIFKLKCDWFVERGRNNREKCS